MYTLYEQYLIDLSLKIGIAQQVFGLYHIYTTHHI